MKSMTAVLTLLYILHRGSNHNRHNKWLDEIGREMLVTKAVCYTEGGYSSKLPPLFESSAYFQEDMVL